jgi:hypothetical protein
MEKHELVATEMLHVLERARFEVVDTDHPESVGNECVAQMGTEKASTSGNDGGRHLVDASGAPGGPLRPSQRIYARSRC